MLEALRKAREVLPQLKWYKLPQPANPDMQVFEGLHENWRFVVASFEIESQGFPPGSRSYDGAATKVGLVLHLTRDLAEEAFKLASASG